MRLAAIATARNEIDIIEAFVRHTLAHVDYLAILDNGSSDGTLQVLRSLQQEGLALEIVEDPKPGYYQVQRMNRLLREYAVGRFQADWTLCLDADEFIGVTPGQPLATTSSDPSRPIELSWRNYTPMRSDDRNQLNPLLRIVHRYEQERSLPKVAVSRQLAEQLGGTLTQGNHQFLVDGHPRPGVASGTAFLGHFPVRSPGQYLAKIAITALQFLAKADQQGNLNVAPYYALLKEDPSAFAETYYDACRRSATSAAGSGKDALILNSVVDPLPYRGGALKFTPLVNDDLRGWLAILHYADELARRYAIVSSGLDEQGQWQVAEQAEALRQLNAQLLAQHSRLKHYESLLAWRNSRLWKAVRTFVQPLRSLKSRLRA